MVCLSTLGFSQNVEKEVGTFSELKVFDLIAVKLIPSDVNKVLITGKNTEEVKIINDNGALKIRMELNKRFDGAATFIEIHFSGVSIIDANEGASISSTAAIKNASLELKTQEGGKIDIVSETDVLNIKAVSGGIVNVKGKTNSQDVTINSGGIYEAEGLKSVVTTVTVTAGGSAVVFATDEVDAKVTAGGTVTIHGNPKDVKKKKFAGGNIKVID